MGGKGPIPLNRNLFPKKACLYFSLRKSPTFSVVDTMIGRRNSGQRRNSWAKYFCLGFSSMGFYEGSANSIFSWKKEHFYLEALVPCALRLQLQHHLLKRPDPSRPRILFSTPRREKRCNSGCLATRLADCSHGVPCEEASRIASGAP